MSELVLETTHLQLALKSPEATRAWIDSLDPAVRAEVSADWLSLVESAESASPWIHGFEMIRRDNLAAVGHCGFKSPPTEDGVVELAYGVDPDQQGKGYATEAAQALTDYALRQSEVKLVLAPTLPEPNASTRVLTKCGFERVGEVVDPDDGLVWRWELSADERSCG